MLTLVNTDIEEEKTASNDIKDVEELRGFFNQVEDILVSSWPLPYNKSSCRNICLVEMVKNLALQPCPPQRREIRRGMYDVPGL